MKPNKTILAAVIAAVLTTTSAVAQVDNWKDIKTPPLRPLKIERPKKVSLPNGMVIFLLEDRELPLIRGTAVIRGGSRDEDADKTGLVELFGATWRTGGTKSKTGDQLDDFLEARAAKVETNADADSSAVSFDALKGDFDAVLPIFVDLLQAPEFREDKLTLEKTQYNTGISRRNDDPLQIAGTEAIKLGYGAANPYARTPEYYTIAAVTREDLLAWHRQWVHPNNIVLAVIGDFDSKAMESKLRKAFGSWKTGPAAKKTEIQFADPKPGVYFIAKDDVNQSSIRMVHLGTTRDNPDYHALEVMNEVFGGGFAARLFSNIRSNKGLAYQVGGGVGTTYDHPGLFQLVMGTKSEATGKAIDALLEEIDNLKKKPATAEELQRARDAILNSFVFRYDTKQEVLNEQVLLHFYGYPADFLEKYRAGIEKVTTEDVARVANKYVHKDKLAILVVGKAADFDRPLSSFGAVTPIDITIPETKPGSQPAAAAKAASDRQGLATLGLVMKSMGGEKKVASIKALRQQATLNAKTPQGDMAIEVDSIEQFPDLSSRKMITPMGAITMVVTPAAAFMSSPMGMRDLPSSQRDEIGREMRRSPFAVLQHASDPAYIFADGGKEKIGEIEASILNVNANGVEVTWYVDPATGNIIRTRSKGTGPTGPVDLITDVSDFKVIDGMSIGHSRKLTSNGEDGGSIVLKSLEVNPAIDPKIFEKPAQ